MPAHAQVAKIGATDAREQGPFAPADAHIRMAGGLIVGRSVAGNRLSAHQRLIAQRQLWVARLKAHNAPDGIAAIDDSPRPEENLHLFHDKRIEGDDILHIARPENSGIHAHPVDRIQQPVGSKAPDHRASAPLLAFLDKHLTGGAQQVGSRLGIVQGDRLGCDDGYAGRDEARGLPPAGSGDHQFVKLQRCRLQLQLVAADTQFSITDDHRLVTQAAYFDALGAPEGRQLRLAGGIGGRKGHRPGAHERCQFDWQPRLTIGEGDDLCARSIAPHQQQYDYEPVKHDFFRKTHNNLWQQLVVG